jgi:hypothetical protein
VFSGKESESFESSRSAFLMGFSMDFSMGCSKSAQSRAEGFAGANPLDRRPGSGEEPLPRTPDLQRRGFIGLYQLSRGSQLEKQTRRNPQNPLKTPGHTAQLERMLVIQSSDVNY